jgi:hypothetical protein
MISRIALWYRPAHADEAVSSEYAHQVRQLFLRRDYSVEELAEAFSDLALQMVGVRNDVVDQKLSHA